MRERSAKSGRKQVQGLLAATNIRHARLRHRGWDDSFESPQPTEGGRKLPAQCDSCEESTAPVSKFYRNTCDPSEEKEALLDTFVTAVSAAAGRHFQDSLRAVATSGRESTR